MNNWLDKYAVPLICLVWAGIFLVNLDVLYLNIMEARNFITAREMLQDGHWLLTTMDGLPRYEKPPLPTWMAALFGRVFGLESIGAMRLPSALVTLMMLLYFRFFTLRLTKDSEQSFVATLVLASSFYIIFGGRNGTWDIFAHAFMVGGIYHLVCMFEDEFGRWKQALFAGLLVGLSFMSKGPISHFALFLPFLIAYGIVYRYRSARRWVLPLLTGILVSVVISAWWPYYVYVFDSTSATEIAQKETQAWQSRNVRPFYYYWSFFTQSGVWTIPAFVGLLYPYLKTRVANLKAYQFALLWTITAVMLLSCIPEKKSRYLLPVLIPLAFTTSFYIKYLFSHFTSLTNRAETLPVYLNFGFLGLVAISFPLTGFMVLQDHLSGFWGWFILASSGLAAGGWLVFANLRKRDIRRTFYAVVGIVMVILTFGFPLSNAFLNNPTYLPLTGFAAAEAEQGIAIYNLNGVSPELIWDYGEVTNHILQGEQHVIPTETQFGLLTNFADKAYVESVFQGFDIEYLRTFDLNPRDSTKRGYKTRLKADYYLITSNTHRVEQ